MRELFTRLVHREPSPFPKMNIKGRVDKEYNGSPVSIHYGNLKDDTRVKWVSYCCPDHPGKIMEGGSFSTYGTAFQNSLRELESHLRYAHVLYDPYLVALPETRTAANQFYGFMQGLTEEINAVGK